jgi:4-amino-4-deoxy-L-arabinose transferase-like glycosyltransferase
VFVLCGGTLVAYSLVTRDLSVWRRMHMLLGLAIVLAVTSGWFVLVSQRNPGFLRFFFIHEHFERFLTTVHKHREPWWYFIPIVLFAVIPWVGHLLPAVRQAWSQRPRSPRFEPALFVLLWCGVVLVFFSASGSKLATYIMPCVPFLALLLAPRVAASDSAVPRATLVTGALLLLGAIALVLIAHRRAVDHVVPGAVALWCAVAALAAVGGILAALVRRRQASSAAWQPLVACAAVGWLGLMMAYAAAPPLRTASLLARQVRDRIGPGTVLYPSASTGRRRLTLGRTTRRRLPGEFEGAPTRQPRRDLTLEIRAGLAHESNAVAFLSLQAYAELTARGLIGRVIATDERSVVIERK